MLFRRVSPALAALCLATPLNATAQQPPPKFDEYVRRVMQTFTVPGLSVAVVATFSLNPDGTVERLKMVPTSDEVDFSFDFQDLVLKPVKDSTRH
jgi:hypothetical protein